MFKKGQSGNPGGRKKGIITKPRPEVMAVRQFGESLMRDEGQPLRVLNGTNDRYTIEEWLAAKPYLEGVIYRLKTGAATHLERFVWEHLFGKPMVRIEVKQTAATPLTVALKEMKADEVRVLADVARRLLAAKAAEPKQLNA